MPMEIPENYSGTAIAREEYGDAEQPPDVPVQETKNERERDAFCENTPPPSAHGQTCRENDPASEYPPLAEPSNAPERTCAEGNTLLSRLPWLSALLPPAHHGGGFAELLPILGLYFLLADNKEDDLLPILLLLLF